MLPCLIFEDDHLLVVDKPAGLNTHAPAPFAGEGLYEWLRDRDPQWLKLAIIHRLDKETSGVIVFSKSKEANRELTNQFETRQVHKTYIFLSAGNAARNEFTIKTSLARAGERYVARPLHPSGVLAETSFKLLGTAALSAGGEGLEHLPLSLWQAEPKTGRTHQIRMHAAESGIPIAGDSLYGGAPAARLFLHAAQISFRHPITGEAVCFKAAPDFEQNSRIRLRDTLINPAQTNCYRIFHGAADGMPGWYVDRFGDYLLSQSESDLSAAQKIEIERVLRGSARGVYHKTLSRSAKGRTGAAAHPKLVLGDPAPEHFTIKENGLSYELSFGEGYSVGIFLDQRDNRRRFQSGYVGADFGEFRGTSGLEVLNTFSYTCAFSVCAAKRGARVTSLDLSRNYLDWGKRNFELNGLRSHEHNFIYGDVFDWLPRMAKKGRRFDAVIVDPPTFSQSKDSGAFRAEKDYANLVKLALPLVKKDGVLFCSCNTATWDASEFMSTIRVAVTAGGRKVIREKYCPQPPDFPVSRDEPAYLKTVWLKLA